MAPAYHPKPRDYVIIIGSSMFFQIPFTWFKDLRLGAKIASTIFASIAVLSCYWLLLRYRIRFVFVWLIALLLAQRHFSIA